MTDFGAIFNEMPEMKGAEVEEKIQ